MNIHTARLLEQDNSAASVAGFAEHTVICVNGPCTDGQRVIAMYSPLVINPKQTEPPCIMDTN